uniref:ABI family member 3 binding protein n=1 Tax=Ursus maritimus TaxID=29073 RepID=A0A452T5Y2_URSMA
MLSSNKASSTSPLLQICSGMLTGKITALYFVFPSLGKRPSLKVHINTTSDSILLKFLRPNPNVKLEGFLLGYGSNLSPNQYFPLPAEGKFTEAVVDAEPKYLIVVRPAPPPSQKKSCSGKARSRKPLQLVVGTLTPSSVFLSWGFLINPHHDWTLPSHCPNDRYYTIRYREKDKEKKWVFQLCPATETIVENLKPNTVYEFGVKDNGEGGIWSKIFNHKTVVGSKNKVNGKIQSTYDQVHTVVAIYCFLTVTFCISTVIQNVTHRASTKSPDKTPFGGTIVVHLIIPGLNETTVKLPASIMLEISDAIKTQLAKNETLALPAESKTPEVEKIPAKPITGNEISTSDPFLDSVPPKTSRTLEQPRATLGNVFNRKILLCFPSKENPCAVPGTRRPPLPPRPVPPRRKPLPPNNVTGKPGSAGIISSGRVTSPPPRATLRPTEAPSERTETDEKHPTAPASGEDLGNITDFSSIPTRETDPLGKPRFKGPHVRYIQKPDNRPCSITDSVKRFPKEDAAEGNATSPPQNPPTNLTVVTVEGCPSFVILDWDKPLNDTVTEYEVISRENGSFSGKNKSIQITNQTFSTVENLKPDTSYEFQVKPKNPLGEGPASNTVAFSTESADPRVSEPVSAGRDAIWTERPFNSDSYSECKGKQYVKRTWYKKFVGVQLCNSLRYKIYLSDSLTGKFYNIGDQRGHGEDHCQFVDSFLDGRTGQQLSSDQLPTKEGYFRAVRQEPVQFGEIGGHTQINYVQWYECGTTIPGKW